LAGGNVLPGGDVGILAEGDIGILPGGGVLQ